MTERLAFVLTHECWARRAAVPAAARHLRLVFYPEYHTPVGERQGFHRRARGTLSGSTGDRPCGGFAGASFVRQPVVCGHDRLRHGGGPLRITQVQ